MEQLKQYMQLAKTEQLLSQHMPESLSTHSSWWAGGPQRTWVCLSHPAVCETAELTAK